MAITFRTSAAGGGTTGTTNRTLAMTPAVGDIWIVFAAAAGNTFDTPFVQDNNVAPAPNGGTYDLVALRTWNSLAANDSRFSCFIRREPFANITSTTVTAATSTNTACEIIIVAVSGAPANRPGYSLIRQVFGYQGVGNIGAQDNIATGTAPVPRLKKNALTTNFTVAALAYSGNGAGAAGSTTPVGWTERQDAGQATPNCFCAVNTRDSGFTGVDITWGNSPTPGGSLTMASIALELDGSSPTSTEEYTSNFGHIPSMDWLPDGGLPEDPISVAAASQFMLVNTALGAR